MNRIFTMIAFIFVLQFGPSLYSECPLQGSNKDTISPTFSLMDESTFRQTVVGNTVVGITRQSKSLYLLYFDQNGTCELWKQDRVYAGFWNIAKDEMGRDFVRAYWPDYCSENPGSIFSPKNPLYGRSTSVWYYKDDSQPNAICVATKKFWSSVVLVLGRAFPSTCYQECP